MIGKEISKTQKLLILSIIVIFLLSGLVFLGIIFKKPKKSSLKLTVWGIDSPNIIEQIFAPYQKTHPYLKLQYFQKNEDNYYQEIIDSFGTAKAPDIFLIKNNWLEKFKKRIVYFPQISPKTIKENFPEVVYDDLVDQDRVWALPNSIDTLVLAYNPKKFNQAGIALPPKTWQEFIEDANLLKEIDNRGRIVSPGASIGTVNNIENFFDIFSLITLQKGVKITSKNSKSYSLGKNETLFCQCLKFYLQFSDPQSENYIWDKSLENSFDSFVWFKSPMIFIYQKDIKILKEKNPRFEFEISQFPQFDLRNPVSFPSYWAWVVGYSKNWQEAQKLVEYLTLGPGAKMYLNLTKKSPALRYLLKESLKNPELKIFSYQALIAKSYWQPDPFSIEEILKEMTESVLLGKESEETAAKIALEKIRILEERFKKEK